MSFLHSETILMLNDSIEKFIQAEYAFAQRQGVVHSDGGYSQAYWHRFAELGWLGIPFAEQFGGLDGDITDTLGLMRRFGRALVVEPYLSVVGLGGQAIAGGANEQLKEELLPSLISGQVRASLATEELRSRGNPHYVELRAERQGQQIALCGTKVMVPNASQMTHVVVSARSSGNTTDSNGIDLFVVPLDSEGLVLTPFPTMDGHRAGNLDFDKVMVSEQHRLTPAGQGAELLAHVVDGGRLMMAAECLGIMETLVEKTLTYTRTRRQFGTALADFQALQHRMADMYIAFKKADNLFDLTVEKVQQAAPDAAHAVAMLKAQVGFASRFVGQQAIQLHGGIGMTDELDVGHYFKRLTALELSLGGTDFHLKQIWRQIA